MTHRKDLARMAGKPAGQSADRVTVTAAADDKEFAAARDGLIMRTMRAGGRSQTIANPAPGHEDFLNMKLNRVAEMYAAKMGCDVRRMASEGCRTRCDGASRSDESFSHSARCVLTRQGRFLICCLDAANKTLLAGYEEAPYTWSMWARDAGTTSDFKNLNRIRFSEMGTPEMVPEGKEYKCSYERRKRSVCRSTSTATCSTISWETVVNDDLDAISRIPAMQGAACRRLQNQAVYGVLTANAAMADTGALFNATAQTTAGGHANLATGSAAPTVATLNAAFLSMMTKKGLNSSE
jgi:hypothetical protein